MEEVIAILEKEIYLLEYKNKYELENKTYKELRTKKIADIEKAIEEIRYI